MSEHDNTRPGDGRVGVAWPPPVRFFGERWDAPAFDDAVAVPVPVGAACLYCTEPVDAADSGVIQAAVHADGTSRDEAIHIECHLRALLGCVAHLEHRCSCHGGGDHDGTSRDDARAVRDWVLAERQRRRGR